MDVEIRHLRYFVAVAEELSFTGAAQQLHMAQPPLSRAIKALEKELGLVLIDRTTRRVELTSAGALFLEEAHAVISRFDDALARAAQAGRVDVGALRIGFRPAASLPLLEPIVREFHKRYPSMRVESSRIEWGDQTSCLLNGRVDLSFAFLPLHHQQIDLFPLLAAPRAVAMPKDHPLGQRESLSIDDLQEHALAVPAGATPDWRDFWTATPRPITGSASDAPLVGNADESLAAVLSGRAFVLAIATTKTFYRDGSLAIVPIDDIAPAIIALASRRDTVHPGVKLFREVAAELTDSLAETLTYELSIPVLGPTALSQINPDAPLKRPALTAATAARALAAQPAA